ncbi:hypothetical protein ACXIUT_05330 [Achromobacter denitrificans]
MQKIHRDARPYSNTEDSHFLQEILISRWLPILAGTLAGVFIAVAIAVSQPKVWPAVALVKIGQVDGLGVLTDPAAALARMQFPSFVQDALRAADMPLDISNDDRAKIARKTLSTQIVQRGAGLIQMQVNGYSQKDAKQFLNGALTVLQREHQPLLNAATKEKEKNLAMLEASIAENRKERRAILSSIEASAAKAGLQQPDTIMVSYLLRANEVERARFVEQQTLLKDQIEGTNTYNTRLEAPIYVAEAPQSPSKIIAAAVGALLGFAAMVIIFALCAWLAPKRN